MIAGLQHPTLGESQKAERAAKIQALPDEAARKIEDLRQKYSIRLTVRPAGAVRLLVGVVQVMLTLQYRKLQRGISVLWNPVTRAFDPLVCEVCGATLRTIYCRDGNGRMTLCCHACNREGGRAAVPRDQDRWMSLAVSRCSRARRSMPTFS